LILHQAKERPYFLQRYKTVPVFAKFPAILFRPQILSSIIFPVLKTASGLMCASPFQKQHKQRKAHDDHNVTSDTAIVADTSFMCLC
ncbi:hypothetical protein ABG856_12250, partial [Phocaeicola vulgatus]